MRSTARLQCLFCAIQRSGCVVNGTVMFKDKVQFFKGRGISNLWTECGPLGLSIQPSVFFPDHVPSHLALHPPRMLLLGWNASLKCGNASCLPGWTCVHGNLVFARLECSQLYKGKSPTYYSVPFRSGSSHH